MVYLKAGYFVHVHILRFCHRIPYNFSAGSGLSCFLFLVYGFKLVFVLFWNRERGEISSLLFEYTYVYGVLVLGFISCVSWLFTHAALSSGRFLTRVFIAFKALVASVMVIWVV